MTVYTCANQLLHIIPLCILQFYLLLIVYSAYIFIFYVLLTLLTVLSFTHCCLLLYIIVSLSSRLLKVAENAGGQEEKSIVRKPAFEMKLKAIPIQVKSLTRMIMECTICHRFVGDIFILTEQKILKKKKKKMHPHQGLYYYLWPFRNFC